MAPDSRSIGSWLNQSSSEPDEVSGRDDEWATSYDADLASWTYQGPASRSLSSSRMTPSTPSSASA